MDRGDSNFEKLGLVRAFIIEHFLQSAQAVRKYISSEMEREKMAMEPKDVVILQAKQPGLLVPADVDALWHGHFDNGAGPSAGARFPSTFQDLPVTLIFRGSWADVDRSDWPLA